MAFNPSNLIKQLCTFIITITSTYIAMELSLNWAMLLQYENIF